MKLLAICLFMMISILFTPVLKAQFVEEQGTLESIYESKARGVLNSLLRPNQYSIVVSAELNRDQKKLDEYREDMEMFFVPGMPLPTASADVPVNNLLHEMKAKVDIRVVIDKTIPAEKEKIIKNALASKLHLDETAGDSIAIDRSDFSAPEEQIKPSLLPDFSWKTWALIVILALLALAGLVYWVNKKGMYKPNNTEKDSKKPNENNLDVPTADKPEESLPKSTVAKEIFDEIQMVQLRDHAIALITQYPHLAAETMQEYFSSGHEQDVLNFFEVLGWDLSKKLFHTMSPKVWGRIGAMLRVRTEKPTSEQSFSALTNSYQMLLSKYLEIGQGKDEENPFSFLFLASTDERKRLLAQENVTNLAIVSLFCDKEQMAEFFEELDPKMQTDLALQVARLENLPQEMVQRVALQLKTKLQSMQQQPVISAEGPALAAKILRALPPEQEAEVLESLMMKNPGESDSIRQHILYFPDLTYVSSQYVTPVLEGFGVEILRTAFEGLPSPTLNKVLSWVPSKKAYMIQRDIEEKINVPSPIRVAQARREVGVAVENFIKSKGLTLNQAFEGGKPGLKAVA